MSLTAASFRVISSAYASDYVVQAEGEIDLRTSSGFQEALLDGLVTLPNRLIVDMSQVSFFDLTGADVLLSTQQRGKDIGTELVPQAPSRAVQEFLEKTGVLDALPVRNLHG
jgi:anti-anti-sigma factor